MKLATQIKRFGGFVVSFDQRGQLRIIGPGQRLYYGSVAMAPESLEIESLQNSHDQLVLEGQFKASEIYLADPAMGQSQTKLGRGVAPTSVNLKQTADGPALAYHRFDQGQWYGCELRFGHEVTLRRHPRKAGYELRSSGESIAFSLVTDAEVAAISQVGFEPLTLPATLSQLNRLLDQVTVESAHLLAFAKTSTLANGTIEPRVWLEALILGVTELTPAAKLNVYRQIVGRLTQADPPEPGPVESAVDSNIRSWLDQSDQLSRRLKGLVIQLVERSKKQNQIDLAPLAILALRTLSLESLTAADWEQVKMLANQVITQAEARDLITTTALPSLIDRQQNQPNSGAIAPYDVNVVFFPQALSYLQDKTEAFGLDRTEIRRLAAKWQRPGRWYQYRESGQVRLAMALVDVKSKASKPDYQLNKAHHLGSAYELVLGQPDASQAEALMQQLDQFEGDVSTKDMAWLVVGLAQQLKRGQSLGWEPSLLEELHQILTKTLHNLTRAWLELGEIPEVYHSASGRHHNLTAAGELKLWSALGARRIMRIYMEVMLAADKDAPQSG